MTVPPGCRAPLLNSVTRLIKRPAPQKPSKAGQTLVASQQVSRSVLIGELPAAHVPIDPSGQPRGVLKDGDAVFFQTTRKRLGFFHQLAPGRQRLQLGNNYPITCGG